MKINTLIACAVAACAFPAASAFAGAVALTVDPTQSVLRLSATFGGNPLQGAINNTDPGAPNTFTSSYSGVISADIDSGTGALQITGTQITGADGWTFSLPTASPIAADYYGRTPLDPPGPPYTVIAMAIGDLSISLSGSSITSPASFSPSTLSATATTGELDYGIFSSEIVTPLLTAGNETDSGEMALGGEALPLASTVTGISATSGAPVTVSIACGFSDTDGVETRTIPVETTLDFELDGSPLDLSLSGSSSPPRPPNRRACRHSPWE